MDFVDYLDCLDYYIKTDVDNTTRDPHLAPSRARVFLIPTWLRKRSVEARRVVDKLSFIPRKSGLDTQLEFRRLLLKERTTKLCRADRPESSGETFSAESYARVSVLARSFCSRILYTVACKDFPRNFRIVIYEYPNSSDFDNSILRCKVSLFSPRMEIVKFRAKENHLG